MKKTSTHIYTIEELLQSNFFIDSILKNQYNSYWTELINKGELDWDTYQEAKLIILNLTTSTNPNIDQRRKLQLWCRIQESIKDYKISNNHKKQSFTFKYYHGIAACLLLAIILSVFFINIPGSNQTPLTLLKKQNILNKETTQIELILDQKKIIIKEQDVLIAHNSKGEVTVNNKKIATQVKGINQVIVPYGKRSKLKLSDGTILHLNAGSHLIYPSTFNPKFREVYINGELYADVAKDNKRPFKFITENLEVEVLGTQLAISDYELDYDQSVILVKGQIAVKSKHSKNKSILKPNELYNTNEKGFQIKTVSNTENYIAWTKGYYSFYNMPLKQVLTRLSRYYNVQLTCDEKEQDIPCSGSIDLKDNIESVIKGLAFVLKMDISHTENNKYIFKTKNKLPMKI